MTIVDEVLKEAKQYYLEKWLQGDYSVEGKLGALVEMAGFPFGVSGWYIVLNNVKTGGSPMRVDLLQKGTGKKWMIPFSSSGFDFSKCDGVSENVYNRVKTVLGDSRALQCASDYWLYGNFSIDISKVFGS